MGDFILCTYIYLIMYICTLPLPSLDPTICALLCVYPPRRPCHKLHYSMNDTRLLLASSRGVTKYLYKKYLFVCSTYSFFIKIKSETFYWACLSCSSTLLQAFLLLILYSRGFTSGACNEYLQVYLIESSFWRKSKCLTLVIWKGYVFG